MSKIKITQKRYGSHLERYGGRFRGYTISNVRDFPNILHQLRIKIKHKSIRQYYKKPLIRKIMLSSKYHAKKNIWKL